MAFPEAGDIYILIETIQTADGVLHEGDRVLGANMPASVPEGSTVVDGTAPWDIQAAKDALAASRL